MEASSVAVTSFNLKAKTGAGVPLDSVFFSIDLNKGVIFNADSLPIGTDITKLQATIGYVSSASEVTLIQSGGVSTGEIDYKSNPSDTIDFSGKVVLKIVAEDKTTTRSYDVKVNVHTTQPDSLVWDRLAVTPMPSRLGNPKEQKTVMYHDTSYSFITESDGSYTLAVATDLIEGEWDKKTPTVDFEPNVRSLCATSDCLYVLDKNGVLYSSADGLTWTNTGAVWTSIIGAYDTAVLGMRSESGKLMHTSWPAEAGYAETAVSTDFPVKGFSDFVLYSNRWTTLPIGFLVGGRLADGSLSDKTWGFDGNNWVVLSEGMTPPTAGSAVVPYFVYRKTNSAFVQTEFSVWMLIGGETSGDAMNDEIYVSYDNGVNWYKADTQMQLPDYFPALKSFDALMVEWPKTADLEDNWISMASKPLRGPARIKYEVEDYEVYWDCPYIYIFGGHDYYGAFNDEIWRGVLNRLTYTPIF